MFARGDLVVNLTSVIAKVVGIHDSTGDPILREVSRTLREKGGKWVADPAKTRKLTADEAVAFARGEVVTR